MTNFDLKELLSKQLRKLKGENIELSEEEIFVLERFLKNFPVDAINSIQNLTSINIEGNTSAGSAIGSQAKVEANVIAGGNYIDHINVNVASANLGEFLFLDQKIEERYLKWLINKSARLDLTYISPCEGDLNRPSLSLTDIYVPLNVATTVSLDGEEGLRGETRLMTAIEAINSNKRIVLLGNPGSGKSTVLKFLILCLATLCRNHYYDNNNEKTYWFERISGWTKGLLLPIPVTLREMGQWISKNNSAKDNKLLDYLEYIFSGLKMEKVFPSILNLLDEGKCIVLLDGLDEINNTDTRREIVNNISSFSKLFPETNIVITCRILSYSNPQLQVPDFAPYSLADFTVEQAQLFIDGWFKQMTLKSSIAKAVAENRSSGLKHIITRLPEFSSNPLLLTVVVMIYASRGTLPNEQARLYQQCCDLLLWQWQQSKYGISGEEAPGLIDVLATREVDIKKALQHTAYFGFCQNNPEWNVTDIQQTQVLRIFHLYLGKDWGKAQKFLDYIEDRAGILVAKGSSNDFEEPIYSFPHRTLQEFLVACYLINDRDFSRKVLEFIRSDDYDRWYNVILLATGHMIYNLDDVSKAIDLAHALIDYDYKIDILKWRAVWWAGEIMSIVGKEAIERDAVGEHVLPKLRVMLTQLLQQGELNPHQRDAVGDSLSKLGDPREGVVSRKPKFSVVKNGIFILGAHGNEVYASNVEKPAHEVYLDAFEMGVYPITNAQFSYFIEDGGYKKDHQSCWSMQGWLWRERMEWQSPDFFNDPFWGGGNKPVVGVSWFEAVAYANWLSKQTDEKFCLPTEAEWERAARGANSQLYPWSNEWEINIANTRELSFRGPTTVGIFPKNISPDGCYDMAGNVWEWCSTILKPYPYSLNDGREEKISDGPRILKGGAYNTGKNLARCSYRMWRYPNYRSRYIGFRLLKKA